MVVIIFNESNEPFNPSWIASQFNSMRIFSEFSLTSLIDVFVVISPEGKDFNGITQYRIAIAHKGGFPPYNPYLNHPAIYSKTPEFRNFLLTKLINSERAALHSPDFSKKLSRTRMELLRDLATKFLTSDRRKRLSGSKTPLRVSNLVLPGISSSRSESMRDNASPSVSVRSSFVSLPANDYPVETISVPDEEHTRAEILNKIGNLSEEAIYLLQKTCKMCVDDPNEVIDRDEINMKVLTLLNQISVLSSKK